MAEGATPANRTLLAVDPGRDKCGVAVVRSNGEVLHQAVVPTHEIGAVVERLAATLNVECLIIGDRTAARQVCRALGSRVHLKTVMVDEHRSSEQGRRRAPMTTTSPLSLQNATWRPNGEASPTPPASLDLTGSHSPAVRSP